MTKDSFLKKMLSIIAVILFITGGFYWVFFVPTKNDEHYIDQVCETKKTQIRGIIRGLGGHGMYHWVEIDSFKKSFSVSIAKIKFTKGINDNYVDYRVGDSLIKEVNSKEFIIKRDTCIAVYILDCDD